MVDTLCRNVGGAAASWVSMMCKASPEIGCTAISRLSASARNSLSRMVASKARRSAASRSGGTPGVVATGRPIFCAPKASVKICRDASSDASRVGGDQVRTVRFENGLMVLAPPRRLYAGVMQHQELAWERIAG